MKATLAIQKMVVEQKVEKANYCILSHDLQYSFQTKLLLFFFLLILKVIHFLLTLHCHPDHPLDFFIMFYIVF